MSFFDRLFRRNMVVCPRCLGKGKVDLEDIKRLKKEYFWIPGKCAYCNGNKKVHSSRLEKLSADSEYLTTDLSPVERFKLINGDSAALQRGRKFKASIEQLVKKIEKLYFIENMEPRDIAELLFHQEGRFVYDEEDIAELTGYIEKVIDTKLNRE